MKSGKIKIKEIVANLEKKELLYLGLASLIIFILYFAVLFPSPRLKENRLESSDDLFKERYQYYQTHEESKLHPKDVVFVKLDQASIAHLGVRFPWGRGVYADFLDKVRQDNPKVVAIDLALYGESQGSPEDDIKLADAIKKCGNVILASAYGKEKFYLGPNDIFTDACLDYGIAGTIQDSDSKVRRILISSFLVHSVKKPRDISFEIKMALRYLGISYDRYTKSRQNFIFDSKDKRVSIPVDEEGYLVINYLGGSEDVETIPIWKVLKGEAPKGLFKDKLVLLSRTGEVSKDMHRTPLANMRGGAVIANIVNSIISSNYIREMHSTLAFALTALLFVLCFLAFRRHFVMGLFALIIVLIAAPFLSLYLFMKANIIWRAFDIFELLPMLLLVEILYKSGVLGLKIIDARISATRDPLTSLYTHRHFPSMLDYAASHAVHFKHACSLILIRITNLEWIIKDISFKRGLIIHTKVAKVVKTKLKENAFTGFLKSIFERKASAAALELNELAILLPHVGINEALSIAGSLLYNIKKIDFEISKEHLKPVMTIGVSNINATSFPKTGEGLMKSAAVAAERAEQIGPNQTCRFNMEIDGPGIEPHIAKERISSPVKGEFNIEEDFEKAKKEEIDSKHREFIDEKKSEKEYLAAFYGMVKATEERDPCTGGHSIRVGEYTEKIGRKLKIPEKELRLLKQEATLHDIGKIMIPDYILKKGSGLTYEERKIIEQHSEISVKILGLSKYFRRMLHAIQGHHERLDGSGYPRGLKGDQISFEAQIIAIADVFDALTTDRPYHKKISPKDTMEELIAHPEKYNKKIILALKNVLEEEGKLKRKE